LWRKNNETVSAILSDGRARAEQSVNIASTGCQSWYPFLLSKLPFPAWPSTWILLYGVADDWRAVDVDDWPL